MRRRRGSWVAVGVIAAVGGLLAGCSSSSSSATTTTVPSTATSASSSSSTSTSSTTTTTTPPLTSAQKSQLEPRVLGVGDLPTGWTRSTAAAAVSPTGAPSCVAHLITAQGSAFRTSVAFLSPASSPAAVIQTVASFPPSTAAPATASLDAGFLACNGSTLPLGQGQTAKLSTSPLHVGSLGTGSFAGQMTVTFKKQHEYLYVVTGTRDDIATVVVWRSVAKATTPFAAIAAKALARL